MKPNRLRLVFGVWAVLAAMSAPAAAQVKVLISGGFSGAYERLLPQFETATGIAVTTGSGASQGDGPQTIGAQLARGVVVDVVILSREGLGGLMAANRIAPGTDVDLARTGVGVAVRAGAPKPDLGSVDAVARALSEAKIVAVPGSTAGIWLTTHLLPKLGLADKVNVKLTARGTGATAMVAAGEAELAVLPVSEIVHAVGVDYAGPFPAEIQFLQTFSAALVAGTRESKKARKLIEFLASPAAYPAIRQSGLEPARDAK